MLLVTNTAQSSHFRGNMLVMVYLNRFVEEDTPVPLVVPCNLNQFAQNFVVCDTKRKKMLEEQALYSTNLALNDRCFRIITCMCCIRYDIVFFLNLLQEFSPEKKEKFRLKIIKN